MNPVVVLGKDYVGLLQPLYPARERPIGVRPLVNLVGIGDEEN